MCGPMLCQVDGKRWCRTPVASTASGRKINHLFHLDDATPNYRFLVDSGAEVSVVPPSPAERPGQSSRSLVAANGSAIPCFGTKNVQLKIGSQKYNWDFQIADVKQPLLGADFLRHSGLLVDIRRTASLTPRPSAPFVFAGVPPGLGMRLPLTPSPTPMTVLGVS